jgi:hypothetical protein
MSATSYGIITEGSFDAAVHGTLIRRLNSSGIHIRVLPCNGRDDLRKRFPRLLRAFEYEVDNGPVDMAIVIRDADGKDPEEVEASMRSEIQGQRYPFRLDVRFHAVRNSMDAWLLADVNAINAACKTRGGKHVTKTLGNPENLLRPKESFRSLLSDHKVPYTVELCREIAERVDLQALSQACPRFRVFTDLVDC